MPLDSPVPSLQWWNPDLFIVANVVVICGWYLWAVRRVNASASSGSRYRMYARWPAGRTFAFVVGIALLGFAYVGPLADRMHIFFWAHMAQHLLVMMLAAPLIVIGGPVLLTFRASGPRQRRLIVKVLHSRAVVVLTNPVITWLFLAAVLIGTHIPQFLNLAVSNHDVMEFVERPLFLVASLLFYYPLIGPRFHARRLAPAVPLISLGLMMIPETVLGMVIFFSPTVIYSGFSVSQLYGVDPAFDQKLAGAMMWALAMVIDSVWIMVAAVEWFGLEERRTARLERVEAREGVS